MTAKLGLTLVLLLWLTVGSFAESNSGGPAAGADLRWRRITVPIAFSTSLRKANQAIRPDTDVEGAIKRSLDAWESVANIDFAVSWTDKALLSPSGAAGDGVSLVTIAPSPENLLFFGGDAGEAAGRTRVFFNRRGDITEADIVLNPYQQFSTDGAFGTFDLESTLTHEIGHLLGLPHSDAAGATMNELQARNGLFNGPALGFRTLSNDDISRIRALYGARDDGDCCGLIEGRLLVGPKSGLKNAQVWIEFAESGRLAAQSQTGPDGAFAFKGLSAGRYHVYAQDLTGSGIDLGEFDVARNRPTSIVRRVQAGARPFEFLLAGVGGQLTRIALPVSAGRSFFVYLAGRGLDADRLAISSTSPFVSVGTVSNRSDFGRDIDVVAVEVTIAPDAPNGEYSLTMRDFDGRELYLPGRLSVSSSTTSVAGTLLD